MIQVKNSTIHYINERALTFSENDLNDPMRVAVSLVSGTVVMAYVAGTIDYAADGNYERWTLKGYSTKLVNNAAHYVYARLSRADRTALVVFSVKNYNIDGSITTVTGKDENGNDITENTQSSEEFFYIKIGELTATDGVSYRELTYDSGLLSTKKGDSMVEVSDMWELVPGVTPLIKAKHWLMDFTLKGFITLIGGLIFKKGNIEKPVTDIRRSVDSSDPDDELYVPVDDTTVPTTAWVESRTDNRFLKKFEPDETQHRIKFFDGIECGEFVTGMIGGSGTQFDGDGYGEMNGLTLREFLEVPELRFNRIDVVSGELWNSVAFGLVESVDTENRICTLKLEGKERAGLKVNDICRGIFADFGDGEQWEGVDECGFLHLYGFWTSYFTPTEILDNDEGIFRFKYALKPGTSQHPTQSMKFAVYGNFDDTMPERQASAYSTRTYKRYLNKVNTWVIDPDRNIYAQYGDLEGLTIGGFTMTGYGSFQSNSYFTGVQIQFTPEQKEDLKGEDSYMAVLSDYVGIVRMSSDGTVSSGEYVPFNVVTEGENVVTEEQNVITHDYLLRTQIQAFKGSTELAYSEVMEEGCFIASINPTGCVATIENGVICVTEITSMEYSYIKIAVNCEGNASFELTYQIKLVKDGESAIYADIDNEMDAVACDKNGKVLFGLPVSCKAYMFAGTKALELDDITVSAPEGVESLAAVSADGVTGVVEVTGITEEAERVLPINVYLSATHNSQQHVRMLTFTVSKQVQGENGVIYKLVPTSTVLKADRDHSSEYMTVSCFVTKHDGLDVSRVDALPDGYGMTYQVGSGNEEDYPYGDPVAVFPEEKEVVFRLYFGEELIDVETVPVLLDGNTAFKSTVFIRSNEEPGTPTGGSYSDPKPDSEPVWFDGIPLGEETLWASTRIFSIDGLYPQEGSWSQPAPMTDTASFDVEFSNVQINPGNPTDNPENWSNEGGTDTWWMATRVIRNGVPGEWSISQIKGEKGEDGAPGEDGKDGLDGKDGADAEDYIIEASVSSLGFTMTGGYSPSSFIVSEYHRKGATKTASNKYYMFIYGYKGGTSTYLTMSSSVQNYTFNTDPYDDERYDSFLFELRISSSSSSELISSTTVSVSKEGKDGAMPRYCGLWRDDVTYEYNDEYRDIVIYGGQVYQVKSHGASVTSLPTTEADWEQASKFGFVAMDTALVDNANIAGFTFIREGYDDLGAPVGTIQSQSLESYVSYEYRGDWIPDGVYRKSPVIGDSGFTVETLTFTVEKDCTVLLEMLASTEARYDVGYVGELDKSYIKVQTGTDGTEVRSLDQAIKTENLLSVSGTDSGMARISSGAGTHFVEVIYSKDSSASKNGDFVKYRFVGAPKLWMSTHTGTLSCSDVYLTGTINAISGKIGGFDIQPESLINTDGKAFIQMNSQDKKHGVRMGGGYAFAGAEFSSVGGSASYFEASGSGAVGVEVYAYDSAVAIHSEGAVAMFTRYTSSQLIRTSGLALCTQRAASFSKIYTDSDFPAGAWVDFLVMTGNADLPSPSTSNAGKIVFVRCNSSYTLTVPSGLDSNASSKTSYKDNDSRFFICDGYNWHEFHCS